MLPSRRVSWSNALIASLLAVVNAQSVIAQGSAPSPIAAFLSPDSTGADEACSGPNGDPGSLYCSIEQQLTRNQPLPSAPSVAQANGGNGDNTLNGPPTTTTPATAYNPNDLTPAQMSEILGALQPSVSVAQNTLQSKSPTSETTGAISGTSAPNLTGTGTSNGSAGTSSVPDSSTSTSSITDFLTRGSSSSATPSTQSTSPGAALPSSSGPLSATSGNFQSASTKSKEASSILDITRPDTQPTTSSGLSLDKTNLVSLPQSLPPTTSISTYQTSNFNLTKGASPPTIASTAISLGTYNAAITIGGTTPVGLSGPLSAWPAGSPLPPLGSSFGTASAPPYPIPTGILPPGHQSPTGMMSYGGSSNESTDNVNGTNVLPFRAQGSRIRTSMSGWGWRCIAGASTVIALCACGFL